MTQWTKAAEARWQLLARREAFGILTPAEIDEFKWLVGRRRKHLTMHQIRK